MVTEGAGLLTSSPYQP